MVLIFAITLLFVVGSASATIFYVPMIFAFGDSLVDDGNNNYLNTTSQANHPPYGINYPNQIATGRWTDGLDIQDYLAMKLDLPFPLCYLCRNGTNFHGANFGSAGSGILNITHVNGNELSFIEQVEQFKQYQQDLESYWQSSFVARKLTAFSIFYINIGNNDVNGYCSATGMVISSNLTQTILGVFEERIKDMYNLGARKFVIVSNNPHGCAPFANIDGVCNSIGNNSAIIYNNALKQRIMQWNNDKINWGGGIFVYADVHTMFEDIRISPELYGLTNLKSACCPYHSRPEQPWCVTGDEYCPEPEKYLYWDVAHPTNAYNKIVSDALWSNPAYTFPMTVEQLAYFPFKKP